MANQESRLAIVIDTAQAEQNAKRLREVLKGISLDGSRTGAALGDLGGQSVAASSKVDKLNAATKELSSTLGRLKGIVAGAFAGIGIRSLLSTADTMQSLNSQVRLVTNSVEQFNAVQERLGKIANNQYADIEALTTLYTRSQRALSQLGKSQNEVLQFTENVSMAMRVGGVSAQEQAAALLQLSQALGSGVLRGDEFNSIAEQAPILLRLVSEEMGVTQGALRELAADGKITSEIVYNAVANATESLTEMAAQMPVTVSQALTVLRSNYKRFVGNFINSTTGLSSIVAGAIGVIAQNFDTLSTILLAGAAVWGYYALASSSFVVSTIPALVLGIQTSIMGFVAQTAAIQAAITAQGAAIASTLSLASMQGYLATTTYALQQARAVATLALLNYKLALFEAVAATQAKIASTAGAIAVQAQYAYSVATSGNLLAIFSLAVQGAAANLVAKVSATVAAARANAIYAASMVTTHGVVGATALGIRALTGAIIAKTGAMIAAVRQTSAYSLAMGGLGLAARGATTAISGVFAMLGRLAAVLLAHPIMALAAVIFSVTASTRGFKAAIEDVTDAVKILGFMFLDVVGNIVSGVKWVWGVISDWFKNTIGGGGAVTTFLGSVFGKWFEGTRGGFVGLLQVVARVFDSIAKAGLAACITLDKGFRNLGIAIENIAKGIANGFIDAFNWVSRGFNTMINFVKRQANGLISTMNEIPFVNIGVRFDDSKAATQLDRFTGSSYITNSVSGNYQQASNIVDQYGAVALVDRGIKALDEHKAATDAASKAAMDAIPNFNSAGGAIDKMGKDAKGAAKNVNEAKGEMSDAEKAAKALNDAFLKAQQSLQRTLNLIGQETNLAQWIYDLNDPLHELYGLSDKSKDVLKEFAASIDVSEFNYELGKSNKELEHQIKLLDAKSDLERELMGIEKETGQLLEKYEIYKNIPGFEHVYKEIEAEAQLNEQLKKTLATKAAIVAINKELEDATADLSKQIFLFGNDSPLDALNYDLEYTTKYANASESAIREMFEALGELERLNIGKKFEGVLADMSGVNNDPVASIMQEYEDRLKVLRNYADANQQLLEDDFNERLRLEQAYNDARRDMILSSHELIAGNSASMLKGMLGEQSKAYRLMFAIEKGYAITKAALAMKSAIAEAMKMPYPQNIAQMGIAAAQGAKIVSDIRAIVAPIGQAHDGIMSVPKSGTWNLEKGERVLPAHTAKAMDKKLEQGNDSKVVIHNYSGEKAEVNRMSDGDIIVTIGKISENIADVKIAQFERRMQRQGGIIEKLSRG